MYTVLDVETSGFITENYPPNHARQGRVLQIGAILLDDNLNEVASFNYLIDVQGDLEIHPNAFAQHGITVEQCKKYGVPIELPIMCLDVFLKKSKGTICHNVKFDTRHMAFEDVASFGRVSEKARLDFKKTICTMELSTPICKIPFINKRGYKWPKLEEAYEYFFMKKPDRLHGAIDDCRSTLAIFKKLADNHNILAV